MRNICNLLVFFLFLSFAYSAEAKTRISLTPYLKNSVNHKDIKKVAKLKEKARKSKKHEKKFKHYLQAAQLGDYESQVKMGFYYGFGTFNPEYVDFDVSKMAPSYSAHKKNESVARYYLNAAQRNKDVDYYTEQATLGLVYLSLDSLDNPTIASKVYENLLMGCALIVAEYLDENRQVHRWPYARYKMLVNTGKLLSTLFAKGIGTECDLIAAHYYALWIKNEINMPNVNIKNEYTTNIVKSINFMPFSEEGKKYGVGLVSALLLKRAADLYAKDNNNPEIIFWTERSLEADSTNSKAYYLAGCLYMNGEAGLIQNRSSAKKWYKKAIKFGSKESRAALAAIREIEAAERKRQLAIDRARKEKAEKKRQRRKQMWAQAIGSIVQAAGNAYMISQGYASNNNRSLLDPNLAIRQVQVQNAQIASLQQMSIQNIQMPQFDFKWTEPPHFTFDWSNVDWNSASMNTYYMYQGDLLNNGAATIENNSSSNSSYISTGNTNQATCHLCHGLGKCWTCNGKRSYLNPLTNKFVECPNCTDGLCSHCHGSGKQ